MNDDFLYRLRIEPPSHFAEQLKERLDRRSARKVRAWHVGLMVLLFGTAFAAVSPTLRLSVAELIDWIRGVPAAAADATQPQAELARRVADRTADPAGAATSIEALNNDAPYSDTEAAAREGARALLEEMQAGRRLGVPGLANPASSDADNVYHDAGTRNSRTSDAFAGDAGSQSRFIVTGPLLAEDGTPAQIFATRRAYFTVVGWCTKPLNEMLFMRARPSPQVARTNAHCLEVLAPMLPEMFAIDERASTAATRAESRIWDRPDEFEGEINRFAAAVRALNASLNSNDVRQVLGSIARINTSCTSCHNNFRKNGDSDVGATTP